MTLPSTQNQNCEPKYICPLCHKALKLFEKTFKCENNHSFDKAKQGYVNLLPVQHKHSKAPGDNKAMVEARRAFLDKGFYQPLVDKMCEWHKKYDITGSNLLDAGCGEGFYTHQHKISVGSEQNANTVYGVDIAKEAIKIAAKRYKNCHFSVGTLSKLSFENNFFSWITSVYAPILEEEFTRVLKDNGYLLTVTPAENHLFELKSLIYTQANTHDTSNPAIKNLSLVEEQRLTYPMLFEQSEDALSLLAMTPFAFKASEDVLETIKKTDNFSCQADFILRLYQKRVHKHTNN
ncbi:MAG: 23S rRNA (guanine(745)-N(1))-methyltransferase [Colwellia sp.]